MITILSMLSLLGDALAADPAICPRTFTAAEVVEAAKDVESVYRTTDGTRLGATRGEMEARLTCSSEVLDPTSIAQVDWAEALSSMDGSRPGGLVQGLAGMYSVDPQHQFPPWLAPEPHPIPSAKAAAFAALTNDPGVVLPVPASGSIIVDGTPALVAPTQRGAVLQQLDGQQHVVATHYRWPDEVGFGWLVPVAPAPVASSTRSPWAHRAPLLAGTAASVIGSSILLGLASAAHSEFAASPVLGPDETQDARDAYRAELELMQRRADGLGLGGYVAGGLGVVVGAVAVITW